MLAQEKSPLLAQQKDPLDRGEKVGGKSGIEQQLLARSETSTGHRLMAPGKILGDAAASDRNREGEGLHGGSFGAMAGGACQRHDDKISLC
ncbi:hypothetical protein Dimus_032447 [Dionaea muscipula]